MDTKVIYAVSAYVLVLATGVIMSKLGRPFNTFLFTAHKLLALGAVIFLAIYLKTNWAAFKVNSSAVIAAIITLAFVIAMFATGAMLSFEKPAAKIVLMVHRVLPVMILISGAAVVWVMRGKI